VSKVTFRADEDLIRRVEALDASKSEVMREALRAYLDGERRAAEATEATVDSAAGLDVTISIEPSSDSTEGQAELNQRSQRTQDAAPEQPQTDAQGERSCGQCGDELSREHIYCPNCGEKASNRLFCDCGDEIRSDWAYCPSCGRRTPSADVLNR